MTLQAPDPDPRNIAAAITANADQVRHTAEAGTVPPASAKQLARLLDTIANTLATPAEPPETTPDDPTEPEPTEQQS
jgi:hypothetical protein